MNLPVKQTELIATMFDGNGNPIPGTWADICIKKAYQIGYQRAAETIESDVKDVLGQIIFFDDDDMKLDMGNPMYAHLRAVQLLQGIVKSMAKKPEDSAYYVKNGGIYQYYQKQIEDVLGTIEYNFRTPDTKKNWLRNKVMSSFDKPEEGWTRSEPTAPPAKSPERNPENRKLRKVLDEYKESKGIEVAKVKRGRPKGAKNK